MRPLQKGDQGPRQRDHRRIRLASVLILRTLRKANYRVPEETQASSVQDDRIAAPSDSSPNNGPRLTGSFLSSPFSHGRKHPTPLKLSKFQKPAILGWQLFISGLRRSTLIGRGTGSLPLSAWQVGQPNHPPHMGGTVSPDHGDCSGGRHKKCTVYWMRYHFYPQGASVCAVSQKLQSGCPFP